MSTNSKENSVSREAFAAGAPGQLSVRELLSWVVDGHDRWGISSRLTLPPLQRNGVWRPKQVLDLWRSVLEGMPIGLFYLQRPLGQIVSRVDSACLEDARQGDLDLFDGQQRVRALALGAGDPFGEERSIWVRFLDKDYELILSSKTQPAGYKADGSRLSVDDRRKWLEAAKKVRPSDLFPVGCTKANTLRLTDVLRPAVLDGTVPVDSVRPSDAGRQAWLNFKEGLDRLEYKCAIFVLLPSNIGKDKTLDLFRRVGAGGTPLSQPEQVYSAYKLHEPRVRQVVEKIHKTVSSILTPAQIVQAALRMAHTQQDDMTGWPPGHDIAIKELSSVSSKKAGWVVKLDALVSVGDDNGPLVQAFAFVRKMLAGSGKGSFYVPEIVMAKLPAELWQVLAFWGLLTECKSDAAQQEEIVRFAMAWHLAIINPERATQVCFKKLAKSGYISFPGRALFLALIDTCYAHPIVKPDVLERMFLRGKTGPWLSHGERFKADDPHRDLAIAWWFNCNMLPWLQRDYLRKRFKDYCPMSDHEDDIPYDWDHICPRSDWKLDGRSVSSDIMQKLKPKMGDPRIVGDSIGNFRLVDFPQNRSDGNKGIFDKMPFLEAPDEPSDLGSACDFLLDNADELTLWRTVDTSERVWTDERLGAFQRVVELRAARLYTSFYDELGFTGWDKGEA